MTLLANSPSMELPFFYYHPTLFIDLNKLTCKDTIIQIEHTDFVMVRALLCIIYLGRHRYGQLLFCLLIDIIFFRGWCEGMGAPPYTANGMVGDAHSMYIFYLFEYDSIGSISIIDKNGMRWVLHIYYS